MVAVGTDFGVYCCEMDNPRGWFRVSDAFAQCPQKAY